ncbi:hypothetical protein BV20DRAFT_378634 [Pilatotrama ljubarskyi]|nr:hypothetical protein BV20DRAFT_378634 [Pilatotrama ljubarskyi]
MHVFVLGGSKNIGYYAALRLLDQGASVTFLLRKTSVFDNDERIQPYIKQGKAYLVAGDALNFDDVEKGWEAAVEAGNGTIDFVLFTIGGTPTFSLTKGAVITPGDLCTRSLLNLFRSLPASLRAPPAQPRFVVVTSRGITRVSHETLPLALKGFYNYALGGPHADKLGAERVLAHVMGVPWAQEEPLPTILPSDWKTLPGLPAEGELRRVVIVRPALLTNGACQGDEVEKKGKSKAPYKAVAGEIDGGYTISRQDTAHFIVNGAVRDWKKWEGKGVCLVY